jgi:AraC family transcriptional regulator, transcriptional activator of the genes for pyochelin and ferripyochelin receptors
MPLEVRNRADGSIIHSNSYEPGDFDSPELNEGVRDIVFAQGTMHMRQWFFDGIRMGWTDLKLDAPLITEWKSDLETVLFYFNLGGRTILADDVHGPVKLQRLEHNLLYQPGFNGEIRYEENAHRSFMIQLTKKAFAKLQHNAPGTYARLGAAVEENRYTQFAGENAAIDIRMQAAINDIVHCNVQAETRKLYLSAKCMEVIALQAEAFRTAAILQPVHCKTEYDRERLIFARDYLLQHYDVPPTLEELSRIAGINVFKLKNGFRELFGNSVFAYLGDYKMEMARAALLEGKKTAAELAYDLGYSSQQHFSTAFRKKFGFPPGQARKK